jgi:hypothetical protein
MWLKEGLADITGNWKKKWPLYQGDETQSCVIKGQPIVELLDETGRRNTASPIEEAAGSNF